jgi:hypothetical protein
VRTGAVQARAMCVALSQCVAALLGSIVEKKVFFKATATKRKRREEKCHKNNPKKKRLGGRSMVQFEHQFVWMLTEYHQEKKFLLLLRRK